MTSAEAIARYLIYLASQGDEPTPVTHLQLQKLLYYAQGWSLGRRGRPLFDARFEAWTHGPVVPEVYPKFAAFKSSAIDPGLGLDGSELSAEDRQFVDWIWGGYGRYSPWRLREMTHAEPPWLSARLNTDHSESSKAPITRASMQSYFRSLHEQACRKSGLDASTIAESRALGERGDLVEWSALRKADRDELANPR